MLPAVNPDGTCFVPYKWGIAEPCASAFIKIHQDEGPDVKGVVQLELVYQFGVDCVVQPPPWPLIGRPWQKTPAQPEVPVRGHPAFELLVTVAQIRRIRRRQRSLT